ncbi:MAG: class I SAM-dependent methyltransferase [Pontixanthobacter sp.]
MKALLRVLIPMMVLGYYRRFRRRLAQKKNAKKTAEEVFTKIYEENKWGGAKGEFCSGAGSLDVKVVAEYTDLIFGQASTEGFRDLIFIDLGCGDFRVGEKLLPLCGKYIGVDVVEPIVSRNQKKFGSATIRFLHLDIVRDELPDGDVCFVRQVLQHLSNEQISVVVKKLRKFRWVFVTEHYPTDNDAIIPNVDKVQGSDIRIYDNSGVYLSEHPFNVDARELTELLCVPSPGPQDGNDHGVIRTFLFKPMG